MKNIKLEFLRGPFGDETSNYSLKFEKGTTVQDVIDFALSQTREWGSIWVIDGKSRVKMEYKYGKIFSDNISDSLKTKKVKKGFANGGWSLMSYDLDV